MRIRNEKDEIGFISVRLNHIKGIATVGIPLETGEVMEIVCRTNHNSVEQEKISLYKEGWKSAIKDYVELKEDEYIAPTGNNLVRLLALIWNRYQLEDNEPS